jgi:hypothetical protein
VALRHGLLGLALAAGPLAAQEVDFGRAFSVTVEPAKVGLGDSITLHFRVTVNERDLIADTVPQPVREVPAGVRILSVERLQRGRDRVFTGKAVVAVYRPGRRELPVFGIPWIQVVTGRRNVIAHDPVQVEVSSVLPGGNPPLRDIREPDVPPSLAPFWILAGFTAAAAVAWLASRRRAKRVVPAPAVPSAPPPPPEPPDPYRAAIDRLAAIEAEGWPVRGEVARHYQSVADVLRDYLEDADGIPARERTTSELLWSLPPRLAEPALRRRVQEVLGGADLVKFAKVRPEPAEASDYVGDARDLLDRWRRTSEPAVGEADAVR